MLGFCKRTQLFAILLAISIYHCQTYSLAQEIIVGGFDKALQKSESGVLPVTVMNALGESVPGVQCELQGLHSNEANGWFAIPPEFDEAKIVVSDDSGILHVAYPKEIRQGSNTFRTTAVRLVLSHFDFVSKSIAPSVADDKVVVSLSRGCETAFTAVDEDGRRVNDFGAIVAGKLAPQKWRSNDAGELRTQSVAAGTWQSMLAKPNTDGRILFSDLFLLPAQAGKALTLRDMRLTPGMQITGLLPKYVPRPVGHGQVIAVSLPRPAKEVWDEISPSLVWHDRVEIAKDGTFHFASLPRSGRIQLLAMCDGWMSTTNVGDTGLIMGQIVDVNGEDMSFEPDMERTGTVRVVVHDPAGAPIENAVVSVQPRQQFLRGDSAFLGSCILSQVQLRNIIGGFRSQVQSTFDELRPCYLQRTDRDGSATLSELPVGRSQQIDVYHPQYQMLANDRWIRIDPNDDLTTNHTITMSPSAGTIR